MESCGSTNQGNSERRVEKRPANRSPESFEDKVMADAKDLTDEIMAQVVENGEGKSEREFRALIEEQLAFKGEFYLTVRTMMNQWDSEKLWIAMNNSKSGRRDYP